MRAGSTRRRWSCPAPGRAGLREAVCAVTSSGPWSGAGRGFGIPGARCRGAEVGREPDETRAAAVSAKENWYIDELFSLLIDDIGEKLKLPEFMRRYAAS